jgi:hypothetical protein
MYERKGTRNRNKRKTWRMRRTTRRKARLISALFNKHFSTALVIPH